MQTIFSLMGSPFREFEPHGRSCRFRPGAKHDPTLAPHASLIVVVDHSLADPINVCSTLHSNDLKVPHDAWYLHACTATAMNGGTANLTIPLFMTLIIARGLACPSSSRRKGYSGKVD